jgi:hypothetical protein
MIYELVNNTWLPKINATTSGCAVFDDTDVSWRDEQPYRIKTVLRLLPIESFVCANVSINTH